MATTNLTDNTEYERGNNEIPNDTNQWGQAILRAKTTLIKPYSKVKKPKILSALLTNF
jgi:hypothetical protein